MLTQRSADCCQRDPVIQRRCSYIPVPKPLLPFPHPLLTVLSPLCLPQTQPQTRSGDSLVPHRRGLSFRDMSGSTLSQGTGCSAANLLQFSWLEAT